MELKPEIRCHECGAELEITEGEFKPDKYRPDEVLIAIHVKPCEACLEKKYDEGYKAGFDEGEDSDGSVS